MPVVALRVNLSGADELAQVERMHSAQGAQPQRAMGGDHLAVHHDIASITSAAAINTRPMVQPQVTARWPFSHMGVPPGSSVAMLAIAPMMSDTIRLTAKPTRQAPRIALALMMRRLVR